VRRLLSDVLAAAVEQETGEEENAVVSEPPQKVPRADSLHAMHAELLAKDEQQHEGGGGNIGSAASQINLYLSEPVIPNCHGQPLAFWKANKDRFPALAQAARVFLAAPCTSVDSERLFSTAGCILDEKRNRLTPKNAEMLIFIKTNLPVMLLNQK